MALKAGDTVRLKSDGPLMTIDFIQESTPTATCKWFDVYHQLNVGQFALVALKVETDEPKRRIIQ